MMKLTSEVSLISGARLVHDLPIYVFITKMTTKQLPTLRFSGLAQLNC